jgi:hypothetical protein
MRSVAAGTPALRGGGCENVEAPLRSNRNALSADFDMATPFSTSVRARVQFKLDGVHLTAG